SVSLIEVPAMAISSTDCRERVAKGEPVCTSSRTGSFSTSRNGTSTRKARRWCEPVTSVMLVGATEEESVAATSQARELAIVAAHAAADKKASDVIVLDVSDQLVITDCFVIASAPNERQVGAIVDNVEEKMRDAGTKPVRREGAREGRWVLLDFVDIVVHVQHAEERAFYALERLWKDCPRIDFDPMAEGGVT